MTLEIKEADLQTDRDLLISMAKSHLTSESDDRRFDWLYCGSPWGPAKAWIAMEQNQTIGFASAFPRRVFWHGGERSGYVLGDFCVHQRYRSLGAALQLQRACLSAIGSGEAPLWYDFPSQSMLAVYQRLGLRPSLAFVRMAKPLRIDRKVERFIKSPPAARVVSSVANRLLKMRGSGVRTSTDLSMAIHGGRFGEEFTALAYRVKHRYSFCVVRSAAYLIWRYCEHPFGRHEVVTARRGPELLAYAVLRHEGEHAIVTDIFGVGETRVFVDLMSHVIRVAESVGAFTISINLLKGNGSVSPLKRLGFRMRETKPVIMCTDTCDRASLPDAKTCLLMDGDRES